MSESYDLETIRAALPMLELCGREGVEFRREGGLHKALCPFHAERSGSFVVEEGARRGHCFGCGWDGDIFEFWGALRGLNCQDRDSFRTIVAALAAMAGLGPHVSGTDRPKRQAPPPKKEPTTLAEKGRPWLPEMRLLRAAELVQLAALRGLSVEGLRHAVADQRLGFSWWPVDSQTGRQGPRSKASWVITDPERWCAQFRALDGSLYQGKGGNDYKSASTKNICWPVGAAQTGERDCIVLVEGGADMLAAYQILGSLRWLDEVAIWCLFGASATICPEALRHAEGRRVRILADADPPQEKTFSNRPPISISPGMEAAGRWTDQLLQGGAAEVSTYDLAPLFPPGSGLKDLNDLAAKCDPAEVDFPDIFDF